MVATLEKRFHHDEASVSGPIGDKFVSQAPFLVIQIAMTCVLQRDQKFCVRSYDKQRAIQTARSVCIGFGTFLVL